MNAALQTASLAHRGADRLSLAGLFVLAAIRLAMLVLIDGPRLASLARERAYRGDEVGGGARSDRRSQRQAAGAFGRNAIDLSRGRANCSKPARAAERARLAHGAGDDAGGSSRRSLHGQAPFVWLARHLQPEQARVRRRIWASKVSGR